MKIKEITLRDYFAAKAMESMVLQFPHYKLNPTKDDVARESYAWADAMLKEREK